MNLVALSVEVGFVIAVPLVVCTLVGIKLDRIFHTMPLFIIVGMGLAATVSGVAIARKIKQVS